VARFLRIRGRFRDGPFYAAIGATNEAPVLKPFEDMGEYSKIYKKQTGTLPQLNTKTRGDDELRGENGFS
jgi:hypothetical protein